MNFEYQIVGNYYAYSTQIKLGAGAYGNVFLAKDLRSNQLVALKKIKKEIRNQVAINIEVDILRQVTNESVIKLIDDFDTTNHKILILELCDQNLREYLRIVGRVNERIALRFFAELVQGFQSLHDLGYCHRDIKPDNILLKDGKIKIIDVNVAKKVKKNDTIAQYAGTRQYTAPEINQMHSPYKADIYSLGIVFYEILYGLQDLTRPRVFNFQQDQVVVNDRIVELVKNMLNQNQDARWKWEQVSFELNEINKSINLPILNEVQSQIIQNVSNYYIDRGQESVDFLKLIIRNIALQKFTNIDPHPCALLLMKLIIQETEKKIIILLKQGLKEQSIKYKNELNNELTQYRKLFLAETKKKIDLLVGIFLNEYNYLTENTKKKIIAEIQDEFQYLEQSNYFAFLYQFFIADLFQKIQSLNENKLSHKILQVQLLIAYDFHSDYENVQRQLIQYNLIKNISISKILQNFNFNTEVAEKYITALKPLLEHKEIE